MNSTEVESNLMAAQRAAQAGHLAEAEFLSRNILIQDPWNKRTLFFLATLLSNSGRKEESLATFKLLLELDPNAVDALNWTAMLLRDFDRFDESMEVSKKAQALDPSSPTAFFNAGMIHLHREEAAEAAACFRRAAELRPGFPNYLYHLGLACAKLDRPAEARQALKATVGIAPNFAPAWVALAELAEKSKDWQEMVRCSRTATQLDPSSASAALYLGLALSQIEEAGEAREFFRKAINLDNSMSRAYEGLALTYQSEGDFDEAKKILRDAMQVLPESGGIVAQYVDFQKLTEEDRPFIEQVARQAEKEGIEPMQLSFFHLALGKAYGDLGDYESSMRHFAEGHRLQLIAMPNKFSRKSHEETRDRILSTFNKAFFQRNASAANPSPVPIFIVGMIRSGTTLMEQILSAHPDVGAAGEQFFWIENGEEAVDFGQKRLIPEKVNELSRKYLSILHSIAGDKPRITDKNPLNALLVGQLHAIFPNAHFIHMRRHPIDNCLSIWITRTGIPAPYANRMEDIAFVYEQYMRLVRQWRREIPSDRYMEVRYEDLVNDRETILRELLPFCGLDWNDACLEHEKNERVVLTPSLWQVRQPIYKTSMERWRRYEPWIGPFMHLAKLNEE